MKMSSIGRQLLEQREGNILHAYQDTKGVWTVGYGHTHFDGPPIPVAGMRITQQEADDMLTRDLTRYENIVNTNIKKPMQQNEFDAFVSICYNVEKALSPASSIVKTFNSGDKDATAKAIMLYNKPPEIIGRRRGEQKQFLTPYGSVSKPRGTNPAGTAGAVVIAGAAATAATPHHLIPYVIAGTIFVAVVAWLAAHYIKRI